MKAKALIYLLLLNFGSEMTERRIINLLYLIDKKSKNEQGETITGLQYKYYEGGPYDSKLAETFADMRDNEIEDMGNKWTVGTRPRFHPFEILTPEEVEILVEIMINFNIKTDLEIQNYIYDLKEIKESDPLDILLE